MAFLPYGYMYKGGRICIDEVHAEQVRTLFDSFIAGLPYEMAANSAGINASLTNVKGMLKNPCYCGESGFTPIVDSTVFEKAEKERIKRANRRVYHKGKRVGQPIPVGTVFNMGEVGKCPTEPFEKAAYIYSLIETEEQNDSDS